MKMVAHVSQDRAEFGPGIVGAEPVFNRRVMPAVPMIEPSAVEERNLVGDVPDRASIGLANHFDPVHDPLPGEHMLIIQAKLVGQKGR